MSFVGGTFGFGAGPSSAMRFAQTRGRIQGSPVQGVNYPSPFFDVAHTYLPVTVKQMFRWCRYYFLTNPLINATVFKLSEYPVTDLIIDHKDTKVKNRWMEYFQDHLRFRPFQIECGLDYHTYGNGMVSLGFPFRKFLSCSTCGFHERADKIRHRWTFTNYAFRLSCPACGSTAEAAAKDFYYKNAGGINMIRWNCEHVEVNYNDVTGDSTYFYTIPPTVRNDVVIGKKDVVESVPQVFIQAMRQQKGVVFAKDNFFHMKRATLAQQDRGWGIPLILPVLKDTFYLQIMKKAQEAILLEHIVPLRVLFPQAGSGSSDPYCVSPGTLVETPSGLVPSEEVRSGDYLRSHAGAWRLVQAVKRRSVAAGEDVYKVTIASLSAFPFRVSEEHPLLAVPRSSRRERQRWVDPDFIPTQQLKVGDYVAYPVTRKHSHSNVLDLAEYLPTHAHTEEHTYLKVSQATAEAYEYLESRRFEGHTHGECAVICKERGWSSSDYTTARSMRQQKSVARIPRYLPVTEELARLVGYYLAEGSPGSGDIVSFAFHVNEVELHADVERCVLALGFEKGTSVYPSSIGQGADVQVHSVILSRLLVALCGKGFAMKRIPAEVAESSDACVLSMLHGLFAGDGCDFRTSTNRVALKLANPSVVLEARRLLLSFGVLGGVVAEAPTETSLHKTTSYCVSYNGRVAEHVRRLLAGDPTPFTGWQKSGVFRDGYVLMPIRKLEKTDDTSEVIGFQMARDKSFCVAGVATHNTSINLRDWRDHVAAEIARWRHDNNYIPILPLPIGNQTIGGDGRALLLTQEIQAWSDQIMVGMGVPREFLLGGMSYAGTNVSMRMLENAFINYILRQKQMANWVMKMVASYMEWPEAKIRFKPFKMADDLQRKAYRFQLNQAQKISDTTLLADEDLDQEDEDEIMVKETAKRLESTKTQQLAMAEVQAEAQVIMAKAQVKAQQVSQQAMAAPVAPGEPGEDGGAASLPQDMQSQIGAQQDMQQAQGQPGEQTGGSLVDLAQSLAQQMMQIPPEQRPMAYQNLQMQSPELAKLVEQFVKQMEGQQPQIGGAAGAAAAGVDTRPLPEKLPPRREAAIV